MLRWLFVLLVLATGCSTSNIEGPQLADPPEGMGLSLNCSAARLPIKARPVYIQRCYIESMAESGDWITISEYTGALSPSEIAGEYEAYVAHWTQGDSSFSDLHETKVDGRPAWYWYLLERGETQGCIVLLSYDDACHSVEYNARRRKWQDEDRLRDAVCSFTRTRPGSTSTPVISVMVVAGLFGLGLVMHRRQAAQRERERIEAEVRARYEAKKAAAAQPPPPSA